MPAYPKVYLDDVIETQGQLFDFFAQTYPDMDTAHFIRSYMKSKTRHSIDIGMAYTCTMDAADLWRYFVKTDNYTSIPGTAIKGFLPDWIGEFYACYQWYYDIPSTHIIEHISIDYLTAAYPGLHDLNLELAVLKVGKI